MHQNGACPNKDTRFYMRDSGTSTEYSIFFVFFVHDINNFKEIKRLYVLTSNAYIFQIKCSKTQKCMYDFDIIKYVIN